MTFKQYKCKKCKEKFWSRVKSKRVCTNCLLAQHVVLMHKKTANLFTALILYGGCIPVYNDKTYMFRIGKNILNDFEVLGML
jgi:hypothetical protein